jgi:hypothetical protein
MKKSILASLLMVMMCCHSAIADLGIENAAAKLAAQLETFAHSGKSAQACLTMGKQIRDFLVAHKPPLLSRSFTGDEGIRKLIQEKCIDKVEVTECSTQIRVFEESFKNYRLSLKNEKSPPKSPQAQKLREAEEMLDKAVGFPDNVTVATCIRKYPGCKKHTPECDSLFGPALLLGYCKKNAK